MQKDLFVGGEVAAHRGVVDSGPAGDSVNVTDATPVSSASERAASTSASARWRLFSSVRARWKVTGAIGRG